MISGLLGLWRLLKHSEWILLLKWEEIHGSLGISKLEAQAFIMLVFDVCLVNSD